VNDEITISKSSLDVDRCSIADACDAYTIGAPVAVSLVSETATSREGYILPFEGSIRIKE
jgi:hypothetical protein